MSQFHITPRAARDLVEIARWGLERWGSAQMETYMRGLSARFHWLARHPFLGRQRDDVVPGYRCFAEGQHLVFYLCQPNAIAIIGIPHQAMDASTYFGEPE